MGSEREVGAAGRPLDWDAGAYDRLAAPQEAWAREIIARMRLKGDEVLLDAGCGSGRVTRLLLEALPRGRVVAVDASPSMVGRARANLEREIARGRLSVHEQDLLALALSERVEVIFSCAVFHHIHDHARLFARLHAALLPGGRLVAQCGGRGNIKGLRGLIDRVAARAPFAAHLRTMGSPWHYAGAEETAALLRAAGFQHVRCWLEPRPATPAQARGFLGSVCLNYHAAHLRSRLGPHEGERLAAALTDAVIAAAGEPLVIDYVRLNIEASAGRLRPAGLGQSSTQAAARRSGGGAPARAQQSCK